MVTVLFHFTFSSFQEVHRMSLFSSISGFISSAIVGSDVPATSSFSGSQRHDTGSGILSFASSQSSADRARTPRNEAGMTYSAHPTPPPPARTPRQEPGFSFSAITSLSSSQPPSATDRTRSRHSSAASSAPHSPLIVDAPQLDLSHLSEEERLQIEMVMARANQIQKKEDAPKTR